MSACMHVQAAHAIEAAAGGKLITAPLQEYRNMFHHDGRKRRESKSYSRGPALSRKGRAAIFAAESQK